MKGKIYLREFVPTVFNKFVITPKGVFEFVCRQLDGTYTLRQNGVEHIHSGKVYQMCVYLGEDSCRVDETQWRLCTKFIPRVNGSMVIGLTNNGVIHKDHTPQAVTLVSVKQQYVGSNQIAFKVTELQAKVFK